MAAAGVRLVAQCREGELMGHVENALDGRQVYFEDDGGAGDPVVIHGGFGEPVDLVRTSPLAQALPADEFRAIYVDHRGHGRSDKPHAPAAYAMPLRVATRWRSSTTSVSSAPTSSASRGAGGSASASASTPPSVSGRW